MFCLKVIDINIECKTINLLDENIHDLAYLEVGKHFLDTPPKATLTIKEKNK